MNPQCSLPDNGTPQLAISDLISVPAQPNACQAFTINWKYVNRSSGILKIPSAYGFGPTELSLREVSGTGVSDETRLVPWNEIAACQFEERVEPFSDGIAPTTSSVGTFAVEFFQVPVNTLNKDGWAVRVDSSINSCP